MVSKEFIINGAAVKAYPLTAAQRLHNYTIKYAPHQVLCIGTGFYVQQEVDFNLLKEAIYETYKKFDSMRLRFVKDEDDTVYQYIVPFEEREIGFKDFSDWKEEDAHNEMKKWTAVPFERFNSPMNQVVMIKLPDGYNGIYLKVDHMTMDSSSIIGFDSYVLELYCAMKYGTPMPKVDPMPYLKAVEKDLEYEADSPARKKDKEFWMDEIKSSEPMYTDFTGMGRLLTARRETKNPKLRSCMVVSKEPWADISVFELEKEPSDRLMQFCLDNHVPMASLLLMGLRTVLSKFNNDEKDVSVKSCVARRGTLLEKRSGGTRIHFFPLRTIIEPETTFIDALGIIQGEQNKIFRHVNYDPIEYTMERGRQRKLTPGASYESMSLTYQPLTVRQKESDLPDISYKSQWYSNGVAGQPLYLTVMHRTTDGGLNFNFEYRRDVVTQAEMEYFYYYLCRVLFRGIEDKDRTVGEILEMI
ncbi:MAG: peptide synthetase [Oscillospiraceae bacterium]|nr:peptide synthetase [Oscillospiraceae bacterium]